MSKVLAVIDFRPFRRLFALLAALIFAAGVIVFLESRSGSAPAPTAGPGSDAPAARLSEEHGPAISPPQEALRTAREFIRTAVLRTDLERAWEVTARSLKGGYTKERWLSGSIPIVPYPADAFRQARFKVVHSYKDEIMLKVLLVAKRPTDLPSADFLLTLVPEDGHWLVGRWAPRGHNPPLPAVP